MGDATVISVSEAQLLLREIRKLQAELKGFEAKIESFLATAEGVVPDRRSGPGVNEWPR